MPFQNWPYSDIGNINLDWIMKRVKEAWEKADTTETLAEELKTFVENYFDNLDITTEINERIDAIVADGTMNQLLLEIVPDIVTAWLSENIGDTTPAVDTSLLVLGAAADAQVTGCIRANLATLGQYDAFAEAYDREDGLYNGVTLLHNEDGSDTFTGSATANSYFNVVASSAVRPWWLKPGSWYYLNMDGSIPVRIYLYSNGTSTMREYTKSSAVYIPENVTGIIIRYQIPSLMVTNTSVRYTFTQIETINNIVDDRNNDSIVDIFRWSESGGNRNGINYEKIDGGYRVTGTATSDSFWNIIDDNTYLPANAVAGRSYRIMMDADIPVRFYFYRPGGTDIFNVFDDEIITIPSDTVGMIARFQITNGRTVNAECHYKMVAAPDISIRSTKHNIAVFGDSIMWGAVSGGSVPTHNTIPKTIGDKLACDVTNYAEGGMGFLRPADSSRKIAWDIITETDLTTFDTVVICFGVNDGFSPIGDRDSTDLATVMGQFNRIINYLGTTYPGINIIVVAPWNGRNVGTFPKFWYGEVPTTAYSRGVLSDTLRERCEYIGYPYITQDTSPINGYSINTIIGNDGVHPTEEGYKPLGNWLAAQINNIIG